MKIHSALTQTEASIRSQQIKKVDYEMHFHLPEKEDHYTGQITAYVELSHDAASHAKDIFMDFAGEGKVTQIQLNQKIIPLSFDGWRIVIPATLFQPGLNQLKLDFSHAYGNSGFGFHRSCDHADGEYYMYSDFEPYNARYAFPVFDQPDLKATYLVQVDAPAHWEVIANTRETNISPTQSKDGFKTWTFPKTQRFSTYLFALIAGPFQKWESKTDSQVPLRLFARKSLAQYVAKDSNHWFQITNEGFKYFEKAFDYPYPFGKYDQILTPDYNHGAMENVAAVTFTENYVFRSEVTPLTILRRAETIIHELAHMWFGNLVTMRWWDDLWLNESFATYVSNLAMSHFQHKAQLANVWQEFNSGNKEWAYREDDYVTTHPIVGTAANTEEALANFDGITYGKGASVLKQLVHYLGEDIFLKGVQNYFKKFAFQNATRIDFMTALSQASGKDLIAWENEWLKTSGTNAVQVVFSQKDGKIKQLALIQTEDEASHVLRTHQTKLGLYDLSAAGSLVLRETVSVQYQGRETIIPALAGQIAPAFIFSNTEDHDFVRMILDESSLNTLQTSLQKFEDPLSRQMLLATLWNQVRHAQITAQTLIQIGISQLEHEKDLAVLQQGLGYVLESLWYLDPSLKKAYQHRIETFIFSLFEKTSAGSPTQILLFNRLLQAVCSAEKIQLLTTWLHQEFAAPGLKMDQDRRWGVLTALSSNQTPHVQDWIEQERLKDTNDKGVIAAMVASTAYPDVANKKVVLERILGRSQQDEKISIQKARSIMGVFHHTDRPELTAFLLDSFFETIPQLVGQVPDELVTSFAGMMYPIQCSETLDQKAGAFIEAHPNLLVGALRAIRLKRQLHQRTLLARKKSLSTHSDRTASPSLEQRL